MEYNDGAATYFFYTKGKKGDLSEEGRKLLHYMEDSCTGNADSAMLQDIHRMVETVRHDEEVSLEYMKVYERERMIEKRGEARGEARGTAKGTILGELKIIRNMAKSMGPDRISEFAGLDQEYVERILACIREYPGEVDTEIADRLLDAGSQIPRGKLRDI